MRTPRALPESLGVRFTTQQASDVGVGRTRHDGQDLARPFRGVRAKEAPETFRDWIACYQVKLRPGQAFAGRTAMRIWGIPCAHRWTPSEPIEVAVAPNAARPRSARVRGRRLTAGRAEIWTVQGATVVDPVAAVFMAAEKMTLTQMVMAIDALLAWGSAAHGPERGRPIVTSEMITYRMEEWGRFSGCATVGHALDLARVAVESPKETETRLVIVHAGLCEPVVQHVVRAEGQFVARVDLAYPELRIAIEYEGDGHRTDRAQWRTDIRRQRDLEDLGWVVIRLTQADLDDPRPFLTRLRRAITARS